MMWKQGPRKSKDGTNEWEIALDKQSKAARNDEQPENAKSKKRTVLIAFGVLLALCLAVGMVNCAASYEQTESVKNPSPEQVNKNAKANPNADKDKVDEESQKSEEDNTEGAGNAKPDNGGGDDTTNAGGGSGTQNQGGGGSSSGGSGNGGDSEHTHNWVPQTTTIHHDAQYQTIHHDAITEEIYICNNCGANITGDPWGHINDSFLNGDGSCGGYHSEWKVTSPAWDETKEVSPAWDETITTGYSCSCGAVK